MARISLMLEANKNAISDVIAYLSVDSSVTLEDAIMIVHSFSMENKEEEPKKGEELLPPIEVEVSKLLNNPKVRVISEFPGPRIFSYPNFLSPEEVSEIMLKIDDNMDKFRDTGETGISLEMRVKGSEVLENIEQRMADLMGFRNIDMDTHTFRIRRYQTDHYHPLHTDSYSVDGSTLIATMLIYLTSPEKVCVVLCVL